MLFLDKTIRYRHRLIYQIRKSNTTNTQNRRLQQGPLLSKEIWISFIFKTILLYQTEFTLNTLLCLKFYIKYILNGGQPGWPLTTVATPVVYQSECCSCSGLTVVATAILLLLLLTGTLVSKVQFITTIIKSI